MTWRKEANIVAIVKQFFWIFFFVFLGEVVSILLKPLLSLPASVIGMVLLFLALHFHWLPIEKVEKVGTWLTDNMAIFFIPAGVGLITNMEGLMAAWWQISLIVMFSLTLTLICVGKIIQILKQESRKE